MAKYFEEWNDIIFPFYVKSIKEELERLEVTANMLEYRSYIQKSRINEKRKFHFVVDLGNAKSVAIGFVANKDRHIDKVVLLAPRDRNPYQKYAGDPVHSSVVVHKKSTKDIIRLIREFEKLL